METAELSDTARKALQILDRDGWNKGYLTAPSWEYTEALRAGSHCIGGAWNLALYGDDEWLEENFESYESYIRIAEVIVAQHPEYSPKYGFTPDCFPIGLIADWNNDEATTEGDVRAVLGKIAAG